MHYQVMPKQMHLNGRQTLTRTGSHNGHLSGSAGPRSSICMAGPLPPILLDWIRYTLGQIPGRNSEASSHKRRIKCDTKHQSQETDATFITSDGSKPYKPWRTLDIDNDNN